MDVAHFRFIRVASRSSELRFSRSKESQRAFLSTMARGVGSTPVGIRGFSVAERTRKRCVNGYSFACACICTEVYAAEKPSSSVFGGCPDNTVYYVFERKIVGLGKSLSLSFRVLGGCLFSIDPVCICLKSAD